MLNIMSQRQDPEISIFFIRVSGVRSRSRCRPESWQRARSWSRSNCLDSDPGTFCLNLIQFVYAGENLHALFGNILYRQSFFQFRRYIHIPINRGGGAMTFKGGPKRSNAVMPPKAPENGTKSTYSSISEENKATSTHKSLVFITC